MHSNPSQVLAARIHALLENALGAGVEAERLVQDRRYARDVLLVCDAMAGTEGPDLARAFRQAAEGAPPAGPPQVPPRMPMRIAGLLNAVFGPLEAPASLPPTNPTSASRVASGVASRVTPGVEPLPPRRWFGLRAAKTSAADQGVGHRRGRSNGR